MIYSFLWEILIGIFILWPNLFLDIKSNLPPNSVVILFADSWRSDHFNNISTPLLWKEATEKEALIIRTVVPPIEETNPALTSFLTGKLPVENKVDLNFVYNKTEHIPSLVSIYRDNNYCTIAVSQNEGAFTFHNFHFGFEKIWSPPVKKIDPYIRRIIMNKDPFFLVSLSWFSIRLLFPKSLQIDFEGIPSFSDYSSMFYRFNSLTKSCNGRPVFGFLFFNGAHFPYFQEFPHYLTLNWSDRGAFRVPFRKLLEWKNYIRSLYKSNIRIFDYYFAKYIKKTYNKHNKLNHTIIISSDHGTYFSENNYMHGVQLGQIEEGGVPWIVFGKNREFFADLNNTVTSMGLSNYILRLNNISEVLDSHLTDNYIYSETGIDWKLNETENMKILNLPIEFCENHGVCLKHDFKKNIRYMKHRRWIHKNKNVYELKPHSLGEIYLFKNNVRINYSELPQDIKTFLEKHYSFLLNDIQTK